MVFLALFQTSPVLEKEAGFSIKKADPIVFFGLKVILSNFESSFWF